MTDPIVMPHRCIILSLVERSWQAAREYSLDAQRQGFSTIHLVKGCLSPDVRALIQPHDRIRIISVARYLFRPAVGLSVLGFLFTGRLCRLLVDNERSFQRLSRFFPSRLMKNSRDTQPADRWGVRITWVGKTSTDAPSPDL